VVLPPPEGAEGAVSRPPELLHGLTEPVAELVGRVAVAADRDGPDPSLVRGV